MKVHEEIWYVVEYTYTGLNDWYESADRDTLERGKLLLDFKRREYPNGEYEYRLVKRTITDEVLPL